MAIAKAGAEPLPDLAAFLAPFVGTLRRSESRQTLERYVTGLLADLPRKTASDIGRAIPETNGQRLQELLTRTSWDTGQVDRQRIGRMLESASVGDGVLILDDTGFAKKGSHSVGVARQYSGTLGRVDNCQVVVTTHYVDRVFDWPVNARVYLPKAWTGDRVRRRRAHIPTDVRHRTKGEIGLGLIDQACDAGIRPRAVVTDAGYGEQPALLDGLESRGIAYVAAVPKNWRVRLADAVDADVQPKRRPRAKRPGRPRRVPTLKDRVSTQTVENILDGLDPDAWQRVAWREGTQGPLVRQFARVRVYRSGLRGAHTESVGWLIGERPLPGHRGDRKLYYVHGLNDLDLGDQADLAHVRWVIERFYQDAKGELGLDDYEGRQWQGLRRHLSLVMLAHCYITLRQSYGPEVSAGTDPPPVEQGNRRTTAPTRGFPPGGSKERRSAPASRS